MFPQVRKGVLNNILSGLGGIRIALHDMPEAVNVAASFFNNHLTIPLETRISWLQKKPDIDYLVKQDGRIYGYLSLVPMKLETIEDLLTAKRFARDLTADDILIYEPNTPIDIYGMGIGIVPAVSKTQKREFGAELIKGGFNVIADLGKRGIIIRSIRAHSSTPDGIRLMRHLGLTQTVASIPGMQDFYINVAESGLTFIMKYKENLRTWQLEHNGTAV
jgi:hypothetical protein